jgi:hypothetical protein
MAHWPISEIPFKILAILAKASHISSSFPPHKWDGNEFKHQIFIHCRLASANG